MIEYLTRFMEPFEIIILPLIILIAIICSAALWWIFSRSGRGTAIKIGLVSSVSIGLGFVILSLYDINTSKSSTAAIGYIFLPFATLLVCVGSYFVSWSITKIIVFCMRQRTAPRDSDSIE